MSNVPVPNPNSTESLERFMEHFAERFRYWIEQGGSPPAQAYVINRGGAYLALQGTFNSIDSKRRWQVALKTACRAMGVGALVVISDGWHVHARAGSPEDREARQLRSLEHHSARDEAVLAWVITPRGWSWRIWCYKRTPDGIAWEPPRDVAHQTGDHCEWDPWAAARSAN